MKNPYRKDWREYPTSNASFIAANMPQDFETLTDVEKEILLDWFWRCILPHKTAGYHCIRNSYRLKHNFEDSEGGFSITNGQFKGAALLVGLEPEDPDALNWRFPLGKNAGQDVMAEKPKMKGRFSRLLK